MYRRRRTKPEAATPERITQVLTTWTAAIQAMEIRLFRTHRLHHLKPKSRPFRRTLNERQSIQILHSRRQRLCSSRHKRMCRFRNSRMNLLHRSSRKTMAMLESMVQMLRLQNRYRKHRSRNRPTMVHMKLRLVARPQVLRRS